MKILCGSALGQVRLVNPEAGKILDTFFPTSGEHPVKHMAYINSCNPNIETNEMEFLAARGDWEMVLARSATGQILGRLILGTEEEREASKRVFELTEEQKEENSLLEKNEKAIQQPFKRKRHHYNRGTANVSKRVVPKLTLFPQLSHDFDLYHKSTGTTSNGFSLVGLECWQSGEDKTILTARKDGRIQLHQFNQSILSDVQEQEEREETDAQEEMDASKSLNTDSSSNLFNIEAPLHRVRVFDNMLLAGGEDNPVKIYDLEKQKLIWSAEKLPADNYGVQEKIWMTDVTLMENGNTVATVDANHHAYVYDRRDKDCIPFMRASHSDYAFTSVAPVRCRSDHEIVFGTAIGNLFSWDFRNPRRGFLHAYRGNSGSIRAISEHPTDSRVVCALSADRRVRVYHTMRRNLLSSTFLVSMQHSLLVSSSPCEKPVDSDDEESSDESSDEEEEEENTQQQQPQRKRRRTEHIKGILKDSRSKNRVSNNSFFTALLPAPNIMYRVVSLVLFSLLYSFVYSQTYIPTGEASTANAYAATAQSGLNTISAQQAALLSRDSSNAAEYNAQAQVLAPYAAIGPPETSSAYLGLSNYGAYQQARDSAGYATDLTTGPMLYEAVRTSVSQVAHTAAGSVTGLGLGGLGAHSYASFDKSGGLVSFNPCSGYAKSICERTDFCDWRGNNCLFSFASTTTVTQVSGGQIYGHVTDEDVCVDLDYDQCDKVNTCQWDDSRNKCIAVKVNLNLDKVHGTLLPGGSPFVPARFLQSVGSVDQGFGIVSAVDACNQLLSYYQCREFHGCEWDGIGCISRTIVFDSIRDTCADFLNEDDCLKKKCDWFGDRCSSPSTLSKTALNIPLPYRFRTRIEVIGQGFAPHIHVPLPTIRLISPDIVALKGRAIEFFQYQFGLDFKGHDEYDGTMITAAKDSDAFFFQVFDAELPYGAKLIPQRNRIIQEKFFVTSKPGYATALSGAYAAFLGQNSVKFWPGEVLEYGAFHVVDENDNVVFTADYHYNYPLAPNTAGVVGLNAEVLSSYGFGFQRGCTVLVPSADGYTELDHTSTIILGDGSGGAATTLGSGEIYEIAAGGISSVGGYGYGAGYGGGYGYGTGTPASAAAVGVNQQAALQQNAYQAAQSAVAAKAAPAIGGSASQAYNYGLYY